MSRSTPYSLFVWICTTYKWMRVQDFDSEHKAFRALNAKRESLANFDDRAYWRIAPSCTPPLPIKGANR